MASIMAPSGQHEQSRCPRTSGQAGYRLPIRQCMHALGVSMRGRSMTESCSLCLAWEAYPRTCLRQKSITYNELTLMGGVVQRSPVRPGLPHILLSLMHCALGYSVGDGSLPSTLPLKVTSSAAAPNKCWVPVPPHGNKSP